MTADLSALIARLEAAEVGSRELDYAIHRAVTGENMGFATPDVSRSLAAALALAERVLPGWVWEIRLDESGATVQAAPGWWMEGLAAPDEGGVSCDAATLALCIAILRAKQGEG